jgi:hypothetical protein
MLTTVKITPMARFCSSVVCWWATERAFHDAHGSPRFPIKVADIAIEYSRNVFPDAPITKVGGLDLTRKFEGMLMLIDSSTGEWGR